MKQQIEGLFEAIRKVYGKFGMQEIEEQRHLRKMVACAMETQNAIDELKCRVLNDSLNSTKGDVHENEDNAPTKKGKIKTDEKKLSRKGFHLLLLNIVSHFHIIILFINYGSNLISYSNSSQINVHFKNNLDS